VDGGGACGEKECLIFTQVVPFCPKQMYGFRIVIQDLMIGEVSLDKG